MSILSSYFTRIGFSCKGIPKPTLDTLRELNRLHTQTIPFENLDPFMGRRVPIDLESIRKKLVDGSRGGYCYEQNKLFRHVLEQIGFNVSTYAGRVVWGFDEPRFNATTHMLLGTKIEGKEYIVDVGFGGQTLSGPIALETGIEQQLPLGTYRITDIKHRDDLGDSDFMLDVKLGSNTWKSIYTFNQNELFDVDLEAPNWYVSTYPKSVFVKGLMVAAHGPDYSLSLLNRRLTKHLVSGDKDVTELKASEIPQVLKDKFGIEVPGNQEELVTAIERLPDSFV